MTIFFVPKSYENPLTAYGRARTIAAFHLAQGNVDLLSKAEMRRDVLTSLMSRSAVSYWLTDRKWLQQVRKVGRVQILSLTDAGLITCANSVAGGSEVPTNPEFVASKRRVMLEGGNGHTPKTFPPLSE